MEDDWTHTPRESRLTGAERFVGIDATVKDFWSFAMPSLQTNNVRGYVAEFLVGKAVGAQELRVEWDPYDVRSPEGVSIEVKSSAYLQAWGQHRLSSIQFTGLRGKTWTQGGHSPEATYNADVYVFCVQTAESHDEYDALDVNQWNFYVLPRDVLQQLNQKSIGIKTLLRLTGGQTPYADLSEAIKTAAVTSPEI